MRLCKFTFTITYLVCMLFGKPSLHPFTFVTFFLSQFVYWLVGNTHGTNVSQIPLRSSNKPSCSRHRAFANSPALCSSWMHEYLIGTVLSLISAHRRSQLKHQKLRVGNYICMDEVLEWFNYSSESAHPGCKVIVRMYQIDHHLVRASSRPGRWWRKLYRARKQTDL